MTDHRDFDRVARAWLDLMPSEAPDRVVSAVLQATEAAQQVRVLPRLGRWRSFEMNRAIVGLGAAVVIAALAGVALLMRPSSNVGQPTSAPSLAPSGATQSPSPVPAALQGGWFASTPRTVGATALPATHMLIAADSLGISAANNQPRAFLSASAADLGAGQIRVAAGSPSSCLAGTVGTYSYRLSASSRVLTLTSINESCPERATALEGTWWKDACRAPDDGCLGAMDAGTYASEYFRAWLAPGTPWGPKLGGVRFTVPDGWANDADWPGSFSLSPAPDFEKTSTANPDPAARLELQANVAAESQATPCSGVANTAAAATAADFVAALQRIPSLQVSDPTSLVLDGHPAKAFDLTTVPAKIVPCGSDQVVEYMVAVNYDGVSAGEGYAIAAGDRQRVTIVEVAPGHLVAIVVRADDSTRLDGLIPSAQPIIQSLQFE
jgi:hypothetical protein